MIYRFGKITLDTESYELAQDGEASPIEPQVFSLLQFLIENRGRVLSKDEIIEQVWDGRIVSDAALNSAINAARRGVGDNGKDQSVIKTFPRRGFRFVAHVTDDGDGVAASNAMSSDLAKKPSIAVLPIDNLSGDPGEDFIGDGLTEDIITGLSRIRSFSVTARVSTLHYKGKGPDARQVAKELGVGYVVEGSVRRSGNRLRVTVQLIDGGTGSNLWAEQFDRVMDDIFVVQEDITSSIVAHLRPELGEAEYRRVNSKPPENLDAWELYHRGLALSHQRTDEAVMEARNLFEQALQRDPKFAAAHTGLATSYIVRPILMTAEERQKVLDLSKRAVALDSRDAYAHFVLAMALRHVGDGDAAMREFEISIKMDPNHASPRFGIATTLLARGQANEALLSLEKAFEISPPTHPSISIWSAFKALILVCLQRHEDAIEWAQKENHGPEWRLIALTSALGHLGRDQEARDACIELEKVHSGSTISEFENRERLVPTPYRDHIIDGLRKAGLSES